MQGSILESSAGARIKARVARRNSSNSKPFHFNFDFDMSGSLNELSLVKKNIHRMKLISLYSVSWQNIFFTASKYGLKLSKYRFIKTIEAEEQVGTIHRKVEGSRNTQEDKWWGKMARWVAKWVTGFIGTMMPILQAESCQLPSLAE